MTFWDRHTRMLESQSMSKAHREQDWIMLQMAQTSSRSTLTALVMDRISCIQLKKVEQLCSRKSVCSWVPARILDRIQARDFICCTSLCEGCIFFRFCSMKFMAASFSMMTLTPQSEFAAILPRISIAFIFTSALPIVNMYIAIWCTIALPYVQSWVIWSSAQWMLLRDGLCSRLYIVSLPIIGRQKPNNQAIYGQLFFIILCRFLNRFDITHVIVSLYLAPKLAKAYALLFINIANFSDFMQRILISRTSSPTILPISCRQHSTISAQPTPRSTISTASVHQTIPAATSCPTSPRPSTAKFVSTHRHQQTMLRSSCEGGSALLNFVRVWVHRPMISMCRLACMMESMCWVKDASHRDTRSWRSRSSWAGHGGQRHRVARRGAIWAAVSYGSILEGFGRCYAIIQEYLQAQIRAYTRFHQ